MRAQSRTIRAFPGVAVRVPPVPRCAEVVTVGEFVCFSLEEELQPVPEELYLRRLMKLPVDDPKAVAEFIREHGPVAGPELACLPVWTQAYLRDQREVMRQGLASPIGPLALALLSHPQGCEVTEYLLEAHGHYYCMHLEEVALYLRLVRDLYRTWRGCESGGLGLKYMPKDQETSWLVPVTTLDAAHARLADFLSAALSPYHVRLEFDEERQGPAHLGLGTRDNYKAAHGGENGWLYSAMCLQLLNDITQDSTYRTCQNPSCQGSFVHQLGRSRFGHRSDEQVLYCTPACARIESQRQQREKRRAVVKLANEGMNTDQIAERLWDEDKRHRAPEVIGRWLDAENKKRAG